MKDTPRRRTSKRDDERQGLLGFAVTPTAAVDEVTGRAGLPLLLEASRALEVEQAVGKHVHIRKRQSGYSEAEHVEALVLLLAAGGECLEDLALLGADQGLLRLIEKEALPSPDAARPLRASMRAQASFS